MNRVTVIVVTFNSAHCIEPLAETLCGAEEVVVVDNASMDATGASVSKFFPQARWLPQSKNLGFGAANNIGIAVANTEFVLLLNPDCLLQPHAIKMLVAAADRFPDAACIAPQLIDRRGRSDRSYRWRSDRWSSRGPGAEGPTCVGFASGACLLIRTEALRRINGFDEGFFLYYEDDDLCIRLQDECGSLIFEPAAQVQHLSRGSVSGPIRRQAEYLRGFHHIQSKFRFRAKHLGDSISDSRRFWYALVALLEGFSRLILLDTHRAWRCFGRFSGALAWTPSASRSSN